MEIKVKRLENEARLPERAYSSNGYDLFALEDVDIPPMNQSFSTTPVKVRTGIAIEIPKGYVGIIKERSSYGSKGIAVRAGVIDQDYRGEIIVVLENHGHDDFHISKGDKIAQLLILPSLLADVVEVDELSSTERSDNGFGSSGQ